MCPLQERREIGISQASASILPLLHIQLTIAQHEKQYN